MAESVVVNTFEYDVANEFRGHAVAHLSLISGAALVSFLRDWMLSRSLP